MVTSTSSIILAPGDNLTINKYLPQMNKLFPQPYQSSGDKLGLLSLTMFYSWFNVTSNFNNNNCSYIWIDGTEWLINFPDGFYSTSDINNYIQLQMYINGHYLVDAGLNPVYFLSLVTNPVFYAVTFASMPLPLNAAHMPAGWTNPAGVVLNGMSPLLEVKANNFGALIGFTAGSYPIASLMQPFQVNSLVTPLTSPITSINVICSWCSDSRFTSRPSVISTFAPQCKFGSLITFSPPVVVSFDVIEKQYRGIDISFTDQNFTPLQATDMSQTVVNLVLTKEI